MFDDPFANTEGEIESGKGDIALLESSDDAKRVQVVIEAQSVGPHGLIQCVFPGVAETADGRYRAPGPEIR